MPQRSSYAEVDIDIHPSERSQPFAQSRPDAPFCIAVLGDFSGRVNRGVLETRPKLGGRRPFLIDRDNFEEVLASLHVELRLPAGRGGPAMALRFEEMDDFHPDRLYGRLPLFQAFRQTRRKLANPETFREAAAALGVETKRPVTPEPARPAPPPPAPAAAGGLLDAIVGEGSPREPEPRPPQSGRDREWDEVIRRIVTPHLVPKPDPRQEELTAQVDAAAGEQMRLLLHHPDFQALEAAWRSLFFLIQRLETGVDLKVSLIDLSKAELAADLRGANQQESTGIYRLLVEEAAGTFGAAPWAVVAGLYSFDPSPEDTDLLGRMARIARFAGAPFLTSVSPHVLGCQSLGATPDPDDWDQPAPESRQAWQQLRRSPEATWLGVALPRFLLRLPYGKGGASTDTFTFEEMPAAPSHEDYLWGAPVVACACLLGEAFTARGWDFRPGMVSEIDGLPVYTRKQAGESRMTPCAEAWLTERAAERILDQGIMPLVSLRNRDAVRLLRFQSIAEPPAPLRGRWG